MNFNTYYNSGRVDNDLFIIGTSTASKFIPIISHYNKEYIDDDNFMYYKPHLPVNEDFIKLTPVKILERISYNLKSRKVYCGEYLKKDVYCFMAKNYIVDEKNNVLLAMVYEDIKLEKKILLVAKELLHDKYASFYKKIEKEYVKQAIIEGIETRFLSSEEIDKLCYSNDFQVNFSSLNELNNHLNTVVKNIISYSDDDFRTIYPGINNPVIISSKANLNPLVDLFGYNHDEDEDYHDEDEDEDYQDEESDNNIDFGQITVDEVIETRNSNERLSLNDAIAVNTYSPPVGNSENIDRIMNDLSLPSILDYSFPSHSTSVTSSRQGIVYNLIDDTEESQLTSEDLNNIEF